MFKSRADGFGSGVYHASYCLGTERSDGPRNSSRDYQRRKIEPLGVRTCLRRIRSLVS